MAKIGFDLSKFKKVHSSHESTTLQHPEGHVIQIDHTSLRPEIKKQLDSLPMHLAEGGETEEAPADAAPTESIPISLNPADPALPQQVAQADQAINAPAPESQITPDAPAPEGQAQNPAPAAPQLTNLDLSGGAPAQKPQLASMGSAGKFVNPYTEQEKAAQDQAKFSQNLMAQTTKHLAALDQERAAVQKDIKDGHIDPDQYMHNMGVGQKISTAIGLILGGMGGALTHQENPALKFLQSQIDRNIQSQMADLGKKENLLSLNMKQTGNLHDAIQMTRAMQNDYVAAKFQEAGARIQDPVQRMRMMQAMQPFVQQGNAASQQVASRMGTQSAAQQSGMNPAMMVRFLAPDEATRNAALKEVGTQQNIDAANANAIDSFQKVNQMRTLGYRVTHPLQAQRQIDAEWEPMMDKMVKTNEGRVTPVTIDLMSHLKPKMSDDETTINDKYKKMINILNSERATPMLDSIPGMPKLYQRSAPPLVSGNQPKGFNKR